MKLLLKFKVILLIFCSTLLASSICAQELTEATLVGEYDYSENASAFESLVEQLIYRLNQESSTTFGLIGISEKGDLGDRVKNILRQHSNLKNKIVYGFQYEKNRPIDPLVTLWLVPANAKMPDLGCRMPICLCPTLKVSGNEFFDGKAGFQIFTSKTLGGDEDDVLTYQWKVSAGKIIKGQGTSVIEVDTMGAEEITATVEISGVCEECQREASFTTKFQK